MKKVELKKLLSKVFDDEKIHAVHIDKAKNGSFYDMHIIYGDHTVSYTKLTVFPSGVHTVEGKVTLYQIAIFEEEVQHEIEALS